MHRTVAGTIWYTNNETNTAGHLPTLSWYCSHFRGTLTENLHAQTSNNAAREQTAAREEPRLSQGTNWTCSHVWIFHSLFLRTQWIGNSISGMWWRNTQVWHRLEFRQSKVHSQNVLEIVKIFCCEWEIGFGGTCKVRSYRGI